MESKVKNLVRLALASAVALGGGSASAQGIPVIDLANLVQSIIQVMDDSTQIANQVEQIAALQSQLNGMTGSRNLGAVLNSPALQNYVPPSAYTYVNAVDASGYSGLTTTGKALRDNGMVYNCLDLAGAQRTDCQASLAQPYQQKGLLQDAMRSASGRLSQITALMSRINSTSDQKAALEIQARIGAENAMLSHELSQIQMLQGMADAEERIARSRDRERQYQMVGRPGRISDFLR